MTDNDSATMLALMIVVATLENRGVVDEAKEEILVAVVKDCARRPQVGQENGRKLTVNKLELKNYPRLPYVF
jgi:hypothetical protein